jgi:hypothetical protein
MKASSARERVLTIVLPALLVVVVYGMFAFGGRQKALTKALDDLERTRAKAPAPAVLAGKQAEIKRVNLELETLQKNVAELKVKSDKLMTPFLQPEERQHRIDRLHDLLHYNNLVLLRESPAEGSKDGRDMRLSPSQDRLHKLLTEKSPAQHRPQLYRVDVAGRYLDMLEFLKALSEGDTIAIPLGLGMQDEKGRREWTLLVWI